MIALELDGSDEWKSEIDWQEICLKSLNAAIAQTHFGDLSTKNFDLSVSVNLSSDMEVRQLNKEWRGKDKPTNVLSFPMMESDDLGALANTDDGELLLGDMILAYETCALEADQKNIPIETHAAHLFIHGMLHLLGYDHIDDAEADAMEALEIKALASLGLPNPYSELP